MSAVKLYINQVICSTGLFLLLSRSLFPQHARSNNYYVAWEVNDAWDPTWDVLRGSGKIKKIFSPVTDVTNPSLGINKFLWTVQNFYNTLLEIHKLPMYEQRMALEMILIEWMKDNSQTDDITVMGVRL